MAASSRALRAGKAFIEFNLADGPVRKGLKKLKRTVMAVGKTLKFIAAVGIAAGAALGGAFALATKSFAKAGNELKVISDRAGVSVKTLSEMQHAAEQANVPFDRLTEGMTEFVQRLGEAAITGKGSAAEQLERLGLNAKELAKLKPEDAIGKVADAINRLPNRSQRIFAIDEIFGGDGREMINLLQLGSQGINRLRKEAHDLGIVMSDEDAEAAAKLTGEFKKLRSQLMAIVNQIGAAVAPILTNFVMITEKAAAGVINWMKENRKLFSTLELITDALASGEMKLAGELLWQSLKLTFLEGIQGIEEPFFNLVNNVVKGWMKMNNRIAEAWLKVSNKLRDWFEDLMFGFRVGWLSFQKVITDGQLLKDLALGRNVSGRLMRIALEVKSETNPLRTEKNKAQKERDDALDGILKTLKEDMERGLIGSDSKTKERIAAQQQLLDETRAAFKEAQDAVKNIKAGKLGSSATASLQQAVQAGMQAMTNATARQPLAALEFGTREAAIAARRNLTGAKSTENKKVDLLDEIARNTRNPLRGLKVLDAPGAAGAGAVGAGG